MEKLEQTVEKSFLGKVRTGLGRIRHSVVGTVAVYSLAGILSASLGYGCGGEKEEQIEDVQIQETYQPKDIAEKDIYHPKDTFPPKEDIYTPDIITCIDNDKDGYGINCDLGKDCDDDNFDVHQTINCNYDGNSCSQGLLYELCVKECPIPPEEICDGKDNDCNGKIDEDLVPPKGGCPQFGVCADKVVAACTEGAWLCDFSTAPDYEETELSCDGKDNDCDGMTDEEGICEKVLCWEKTFGDDKTDNLTSVLQISDDSYIVAGYKWVKGIGWTPWVLNLDREGEVKWEKTYENIYGGSMWSTFESIEQTEEGGYIAAGSISWEGPLEDTDGLVAKLDPQGEIEWTEFYGEKYPDGLFSIKLKKGGGYIAAGFKSKEMEDLPYEADADAWLLNLDEMGKRVWEKILDGGYYQEVSKSAEQTQEGGYITASLTVLKGAGESDAWAVYLNPQGEIVWDGVFGESGAELASLIRQTSEGEYVMAGQTNSKGAGDLDIWVLKFDENKLLEWDKTLGGEYYDAVNGLELTKDGGIVVAGRIGLGWAGPTDLLLAKLNSEGETVWEKTYGGDKTDIAYSVKQTSDGGYITVGSTESGGANYWDGWVLKLDAEGNLDCK